MNLSSQIIHGFTTSNTNAIDEIKVLYRDLWLINLDITYEAMIHYLVTGPG